MRELSELVKAKIDEMIFQGDIEKIIGEKLEKMIEDSIGTAIRLPTHASFFMNAYIVTLY